MGGSSSKDEGNFPYLRGSKDARDISNKISHQLKKDFSHDNQTVKLLLLGAGQSGKSTIVKQMKLIHPLQDRSERGFTEKERNEARVAVYANMVDAMLALLDAVEYLNIEGVVRLTKEAGNEGRIRELGNIIEKFGDNVYTHYDISSRNKADADAIAPTDDVKTAFKELWSSKTIQAAYGRRNEFQLIDSTEYFMSAIDRIFSKDYEPTDQDVLRTRVQTTGVVRIEFEFNATNFLMLDVGGQRSERKKWIHCFDHVTCVLFVISISEYDQVLEEDKTTNRMKESMKLFQDIANNDFFKMKPIIIFFNKHDLFLEKIEKRGIKETFPDYQGADNEPNESLNFLIGKYISLSQTDKKKRPIYPHTTTATDTQLINKVFSSAAEIILNDILKTIGFE